MVVLDAMSVVEMVGSTGAVVVAFTDSLVVVIGGRVDMPSALRDMERTRHRVANEARYLMMAGRTQVSPNGKGRPFYTLIIKR